MHRFAGNGHSDIRKKRAHCFRIIYTSVKQAELTELVKLVLFFFVYLLISDSSLFIV